MELVFRAMWPWSLPWTGLERREGCRRPVPVRTRNRPSRPSANARSFTMRCARLGWRRRAVPRPLGHRPGVWSPPERDCQASARITTLAKPISRADGQCEAVPERRLHPGQDIEWASSGGPGACCSRGPSQPDSRRLPCCRVSGITDATGKPASCALAVSKGGTA